MTARHTSAEAYASINSKAHSDRALIAELVRRRGPMTRREIASYLHMETSSAAGRVNELMHDSLLVELDEPMPCPITKRRVNWLMHADCAPGFQMGMAIRNAQTETT